jgi:Barrel-sandwich domain of CusB or HlyD membrane-fusion
MTERNAIDDKLNAYVQRNRYRPAFFITLFAAIVLAIAVALLWWRSNTTQPTNVAHSSASPESMSGMAQPNDQEPASGGASMPQPEAPLAPIQLTPQRMQSIGIVLGKVESTHVNSELRFYGNVEVDERRRAYVQTRFAGWIRKVYADATGNFIRKGQPLFTIYSPDLVTTEQEYLLAKKNSDALQQSSVKGVASGASSLFNAAKERLLQWEVSPAEIEKLDQGGKPITDLTVNSPVSGYITQKNALANMYVQPETMLYTVADLSDVWVVAQVFQSDAGKIKPGGNHTRCLSRSSLQRSGGLHPAPVRYDHTHAASTVGVPESRSEIETGDVRQCSREAFNGAAFGRAGLVSISFWDQEPDFRLWRRGHD